ncbi:MAG TPA: nucleotidyl transferase AbiEii/AbiGii toxin family protein [Nitrosomonas europaea]|uniref:nucleotidyl transferase AbiEii/AbiGii toxin family protein n=1 Tax=Nitrosomonas europaea TaxID=915 RepID=UPI0024903E9C|nr:nucleotidyl transferase AbiEii/AbiGii toxin family protein [Nitrosomonas europaea]HRN82744.1 nucleotidyl transferase AbiEii/AbiGii toxin family protein [Nitrosomonas europaea]HRO57229.1 nucleotidyl transferase AbiEii/AbiGii toxin family protein [Nitrosomonas europaea]HUM74849.1 nucleotidyl transferase AbiEii/AbiGii toxin family protein [Nitrosomonas europaea]
MNVRPDKDLLIEVAALKGMKESFVEKDWLVTQVIRTIRGINQDGFEVVFSGGTALSKAHNLLFRFSEDVDFRLLVNPELHTRKNLSSFKYTVLDALRADGFAIEAHHVKARDENRFFSIDLEYETVFPRENSLRPHIQIEMTARNIQLPHISLPVSSFLNELAKHPPEVVAISCIDPVESAADKLSAIAWRIPDRVRGGQYDDPSIVRHIHDLAILKDRALAHAGFAGLVAKSMQEDNNRAKNDPSLEGMAMPQKLDKMLDILITDKAYAEEYRRFIEDVSYAKSSQTLDFENAIQAVQVLIKAVSQ